MAHALEWSPQSSPTPDEIAEPHERRGEELARAANAVTAGLLDSLEVRV